MLRHIQFESRLSPTGSNADERVKVSPSEQIQALLLLAKLTGRSGENAPAELESFDGSSLGARLSQAVQRVARELVGSAGASIVLSDSNDIDVQIVVNYINTALGNYGHTLDLDTWSEQRLSADRGVIELVSEMNSGAVNAVIFSGVNPAYDYYANDDLSAALKRVPLKISLNSYRDETSALCDFVCPQHHFLEAWDDAAPARGIFSLGQPAIAPLFQTRQYQESLMRWSGDDRSFYDALRESWQQQLFPRQAKHQNFDDFWDSALRDGAVTLEKPPQEAIAFNRDGIARSLARLRDRATTATNGLSLLLYEKTSMRDGRHANNPWLQELPDPLTKITWDNYACVSPGLASKLGLEEGVLARISNNAASIELPVHIQPGQDDSSIAIAIGYGRTRAGRVGNGIGANAFPLVSFDGETFQYTTPAAKIEKLPGKIEFASTQRHNTMDGRPIVREMTLDDFLQGAKEETEHESRSIWKDHPYGEHKWGMVVDLNACVGCSACIVSCQAENNIPVVGRDEVRRQREMHWLRIDRYYTGPEDDPGVVFQPVMCMQCDNASCESVCPVLATVHSSEGLNMQVYNRCVGTRYCENNCAYKVRRFNWFQYPHDDPLANLALNPDVTVRSRGVMEKCTFCVQRIEEVKIRARNEGRDIRDGEVQPACVQSCPANAIVFGDLANAQSQVNKLKHDDRDYILLEELNLRPAISYLAKVRNSEEIA
jgi:molybdopterin-containing oxidoreductase family iron-sulfur binding subunit